MLGSNGSLMLNVVNATAVRAAHRAASISKCDELGPLLKNLAACAFIPNISFPD